MNDWHFAQVISNQRVAEGLSLLRLDIGGTPLVGAHHLAGQYVRLSLEGTGEGFFAITSAPSPEGRELDFLIKGGSPLADKLSALLAGGKVLITLPGGKGFPIESARGKHVLLFATGSGISPIRSAIEVLRQDRKSFKNVTLYFGARTPDSFAYADQLDAWGKEGIRIFRTVSQPGASGWQGLTGYVQAHIGEEPLVDAVAFLCGQKAMVQAVTDVLVQRGLHKENIFQNF
jgi:sulfhydrogenase subunit gamma (sulfur reductase)